MALLNSLKKLFGTSKDLGAAKIEELKDKAVPVVGEAKEKAKDVVDKVESATVDIRESAKEFGEKVQDFGEDLIEKAKGKLDELEDSAENFVEDLNTKLQQKLNKSEVVPEIETTPVESVKEPVTEVADEAKESVTNAEKPKK